MPLFVDFSSSVANARSRAFRNLCPIKSPHEYVRVCTRRGSNSRNWPIPGSKITWYATGATGRYIDYTIMANGAAAVWPVSKQYHTAAARVIFRSMLLMLVLDQLVPRHITVNHPWLKKQDNVSINDMLLLSGLPPWLMIEKKCLILSRIRSIFSIIRLLCKSKEQSTYYYYYYGCSAAAAILRNTNGSWVSLDYSKWFFYSSPARPNSLFACKSNPCISYYC